MNAASIRECLDHFIGRTVVDITAHDPGVDVAEHITLMFDDGSCIRMPLTEFGLAWSTANNCLEHIGCIAGENPTPDPRLLIAT